MAGSDRPFGRPRTCDPPRIACTPSVPVARTVPSGHYASRSRLLHVIRCTSVRPRPGLPEIRKASAQTGTPRPGPAGLSVAGSGLPEPRPAEPDRSGPGRRGLLMPDGPRPGAAHARRQTPAQPSHPAAASAGLDRPAAATEPQPPGRSRPTAATRPQPRQASTVQPQPPGRSHPAAASAHLDRPGPRQISAWLTWCSASSGLSQSPASRQPSAWART
jgi:hypothetical protein